MSTRIQDRIAGFNTVAAAVTMAVVFVAVYAVVRFSAYNHLDADIRSEQEEVMSNLDQNDSTIIIKRMPEWEEAEHAQVEVNPTFIQVVDARGVSIFKTANLRDDQFLFERTEMEERFFDTELDDQHLRQGQFTIRNSKGAVLGYLTIGVSEEESVTVLHNLLLTLLLLFPIVLIILYFTGSFATRRSIAPVHHMIAAASGMNSASISARLPLPAQQNEFHELATTINGLLDRIEASFRQQKQFTADASHEMRTPLAGVRGTLEVLIRQTRTPEHYEGRIKEVIATVDRLDGLLDSLLELARLDAGHTVVNLRPVRLMDAIEAVRAKRDVLMWEKGVHWLNEVPMDIEIAADPVLLEVMLDNVIGNAVNHGRAHGKIIVTYDRVERSVSIADDGDGIPAAHIPHLFERFYRADQSRSAKVSGHGLGLSIVKKLADLQGLTVSAESVPGQGARFSVRFPAAKN